MYEVRSTSELTSDLIKLAPEVPAIEPVAKIALIDTEPPKPIAIVGVHGISPIQQYAFQDQLANGMLSYLNAGEAASATGRKWRAMVYWPRVHCRQGDPVLKPSALRLYRDDEPDPESPRSRVYDVYEGYWSPYSKGKTNVVSMLRWLLSITFLATSSTARVPASWRKARWDIGYLLTALLIAAVLLLGAFVAGVFAWNQFVTLFWNDPVNPPPPFWTFAVNPLAQIAGLRWYGWAQLAFDILVAYLLVQLVVVWRTRAQTARRTRELRKDAKVHGRFHNETISADAFHRVATIVFVILVVLLLAVDLVTLLTLYPDTAAAVAWHGVLLVAAVAMLQGARGIAGFAVEDLLGDVQIYTTHDCNSTYYAIRGLIIDAVTKALLGALNAVDITRTEDGQPAPLYEKIHFAGHSLGTTVGLDVLIRVRQLAFENADLDGSWARIRSFTTFGTALEKTRFFFDVRNPTVSASQQQWKNDVYGKYFTLDRATLHGPDNRDGIFWSNHWYFHDIVANRIVSYESNIAPGQPFNTYVTSPKPHPICEDNEIPHPRPFWAFVHSDYLGDPLFWKNAGPVFTS
ncbi:MAG TPA: hypothetical protein VHS78_16280 [Candidatus Elarobacter sp.]|jgi:hypothetical protein|nr:hypothetical protein [Candidatus Elarobacter sp.]